MMEYIVFCPYFGKLPHHFNLWLKSCSYNKKIKFLIFTDDTDIKVTDVPENVEIRHITFSELKEQIQKKFNFNIAINSPYKLCDYKPAYGYIFEEELEKYKYWGYCDLDMIFGDVCKFLPNEKENYDKISFLGHLCFIKNEHNLNRAFMLPANSKINYIDIFSSDYHFGFDEIGDYGINSILINNKFKIYNYERFIADVSCARRGMALAVYKDGKFRVDEKPRIFCFEQGKILSKTLNCKTKQIDTKEYAYVHFQKRKMINFDVDNNTKNFYILPKGFKSIEDQTGLKKIILDNYKGRLLWFIKRMKFKKNALVKQIKRKIIIQNILNKK